MLKKSPAFLPKQVETQNFSLLSIFLPRPSQENTVTVIRGNITFPKHVQILLDIRTWLHHRSFYLSCKHLLSPLPIAEFSSYSLAKKPYHKIINASSLTRDQVPDGFWNRITKDMMWSVSKINFLHIFSKSNHAIILLPSEFS